MFTSGKSIALIVCVSCLAFASACASKAEVRKVGFNSLTASELARHTGLVGEAYQATCPSEYYVSITLYVYKNGDLLDPAKYLHPQDRVIGAVRNGGCFGIVYPLSSPNQIGFMFPNPPAGATCSNGINLAEVATESMTPKSSDWLTHADPSSLESLSEVEDRAFPLWCYPAQQEEQYPLDFKESERSAKHYYPVVLEWSARLVREKP